MNQGLLDGIGNGLMDGLLAGPVGSDRGLRRFTDDYVLIRQQFPNDTEPGGVAGGWATRQLNTVVDDDAGLVKRLASGIITISEGLYRCRGHTMCYGPEGYFNRLYSITRATMLAPGGQSYVAGNRGLTAHVWVEGVFEVTDNEQIALQENGTSGNGNSYAGGPSVGARASNYTEIEVTATLELWRV
jgi:hypothetical protein